MQIRRTAAAVTCAAGLTLSGVAAAAPAYAEPTFQGGLVNVDVDDIRILNNSLNNVRILNDNQVSLGVVAQLQAQVCDNNVNLIGLLRDTGEATCETEQGDIDFTTVQDQ